MKILVGSTGLIGQTLKQKIKFDYGFNSKNIQDLKLCDNNCDLYLSCLPATKWWVNQNIKDDIKNIQNIVEVISQKRYRKIYLFSTIDVYSNSPLKSNEDYSPNISGINYGSNRLLFEYMVRQLIEYEKFYIFRLPALFGKFLKKNIIYDLLNNNNIDNINLNSYYQWYNLENLIYDIEQLVRNNPNKDLFNLFTEPIFSEELVEKIFPEVNLSNRTDLISYDWTTKYSSTGYLYNKDDMLKQIKKFVYEIRNQ